MLVYGIELQDAQFDRLIEILYNQSPEKAKEYCGYKEGDINSPLDCFRYSIIDDPMDYPLLPGTTLVRHENGNYWLDFGAALEGRVVNGKVVLVQFSAEEVEKAFELAKEAGVEDPRLDLDYWVEWG
jgi:hypothetical protein